MALIEQLIEQSEAPAEALAATSPTAGDRHGAPGPQVYETLYLAGRPPLKGFIRYVRGHAVEPPDDGVLAERWNDARRVVEQLTVDEAGAADNPGSRKLGPSWHPLLKEFLRDPLVRNGFNLVPTEIALVELDKLVVYQEHVDVTFARDLAERLGPSPSDEMLFRTCLPYDHPHPPVRWAKMHGDKYVFMSPSNDMRFLGPVPLEAGNITGCELPGSVVGVVGLAVGFGSNFMNAVRVGNRIVLNNGTHRAYALRRMGIEYAPCIVQHCASREELDAIGSSDIHKGEALYLDHPRPPMLRDYFDARLHMVMPVRRRLRQVTVTFSTSEDFVPAM